MFIKTRNTAVITAILFLIVVVALRVAANVFGANADQIVGAIFAGSAEDIQLLESSSSDTSWFDMSSWSFSLSETLASLNAWFHTIVDNVFPAVIDVFSKTPVYLILAISPEAVTRVLQVSAATATIA